MGGFCMFWKVCRLVFGLFCGYLFVYSLTAIVPLHSEHFLSEFILNPFEFLTVAVALVFGIYAIGGLFRDGGIALVKAYKGSKGLVFDIILAIICLGSVFLLLPLGIWPTAVFFVFCLLYGMMSFSSPEDGNEN
jgi:hypothetical protein